MAQFFNFKQDHYGLTESEVEKNIALYGFNTYTKNGKKDVLFRNGRRLGYCRFAY